MTTGTFHRASGADRHAPRPTAELAGRMVAAVSAVFLAAGAAVGIPGQVTLGGLPVGLVLAAGLVINAASIGTTGLVFTDMRVYALALVAIIAGVLGPGLADAGTSTWLASLDQPFEAFGAALFAAGSQASLWGLTYAFTGLLIDGLQGRKPRFESLWQHWTMGLAGGAAFGAVIILGVHAGALAAEAIHASAAVDGAPVAWGAFLGAPLYPALRALLETVEGGESLYVRLVRALGSARNWSRGALTGMAVALTGMSDLPAADGGTRFITGAVAGFLIYAGVDWAAHAAGIVGGERRRFESWRIYAVRGVMGAVVGGLIAAYLDTAQLARLSERLGQFATTQFAEAGLNAPAFVGALISGSWGTIDLGVSPGGVRLLYNQSLFGVLTFAIAAPLFSLNLVFLTALVKGSLDPVRELFSRRGLIALLEHMLRVQRWGLWMAPAVTTGLRPMSDPTWYNQDGAVRTVAAIVENATAGKASFAGWALDSFASILAYEWLRFLIWIDHMALRVATLVNATFVVADRLDESAARFIGHAAPTRIAPEGIRRFMTWTPLFIPFYIPYGADWDRAWAGAELLRAGAPPPEAAIDLTFAYGVAAMGVLGLIAFVWQRWRGQRRMAGPDLMRLSNGRITVEVTPSGLGSARIARGGAPWSDYDLTKRPDDRENPRGHFLFVQDRDSGAVFSLTAEPRIPGAAAHGARHTGDAIVFTARDGDLAAEAVITLDPFHAHALTRLSLVNRGARPRRLRILTFRETAIAPPHVHQRTPAMHGLYVGTLFVRALGAVMAENRILKTREGLPWRRRTVRPVAYHALRETASVRLAGYQDARDQFLGKQRLATAAAFAVPEALRDVTDEGFLYGFDPCAALAADIDLGPGASEEVLVADGAASGFADAADRIANAFGVPKAVRGVAQLLKKRRTVAAPAGRAAQPAFAFSSDGAELTCDHETPRLWSHVMGNPDGAAAIAGNDGHVFAWVANGQLNAVTPYGGYSATAQAPGTAWYVHDRETGETLAPGWVPARRSDHAHRTVFGLGYAVHETVTPRLAMARTTFVPPEGRIVLQSLRIENRSAAACALRLMPYAQLVLGEIAADTAGRITSESPEPGVLLFRNPGNGLVPGWAFVAASFEPRMAETVRARVIGRDGSLADPVLARTGTPDAAAPDDGLTCAAFTGEVSVAPGLSVSAALVIGFAPSRDAALAEARRWRAVRDVEEALRDTRDWWRDRLGRLTVETNDPAFDRMVNLWLPYQAQAARLWARCGPDQRSGANGFRDQLQDSVALMATDPHLARAQILHHAAQQFHDGGVLHWWHRSGDGRTGLGARTRAADLPLWLPHITARYIEATGDRAILDAEVPFLDGRPMPFKSEGILAAPRATRDTAPLWEHIRRAIAFVARNKGAHGLPLMLGSDWNDGLDAVGHKGRGESVWMGMFMAHVLERWAPYAEIHEGESAAERYRGEAASLREAVARMERGAAYAVAITDTGAEMLFDYALTSSWAVLSGVATGGRALEVLRAASAALARPHQVLLLQPAFDDTSKPKPGRIADYPKGVRENGAQYSHGATWLVDAWVEQAAARHAEAPEEAAALFAEAEDLWRRVSPLDQVGPAAIARYGLAPHQQPADIYWGEGFEGRGGWSWYTGSAARMYDSALKLIGVDLRGGLVVLRPDAMAPKGRLTVKRITHRGRVIAER